MATLAPLVIPALKKHTASVIWAHGLGDQGSGWAPVAENFRLRGKFDEVSFIFPNAPPIPITMNFNMPMPGWYDITDLTDLTRAHDRPGILKSRDYFNGLIRDEMEKGIPSNRIVLGGFSQGGAMSLFTGITCNEKLAGIFGLSSYMVLHDKIKDYVIDDAPNQHTPIFMGHGNVDAVVRYEWGQQTDSILRGLGFKVDFRTYKGLAHSADPKEMDDLEGFLRERLPQQH